MEAVILGGVLAACCLGIPLAVAILSAFGGRRRRAGGQKQPRVRR